VVVALGLALAPLGVGASRTVSWLQREDAASQGYASQQGTFSCLEHRLHRLVRPRTAVAIGSDSALWRQRLVEWSTPWLIVIADPRKASAVLRVHHVPGGCSGYDIRVLRTT